MPTAIYAKKANFGLSPYSTDTLNLTSDNRQLGFLKVGIFIVCKRKIK